MYHPWRNNSIGSYSRAGMARDRSSNLIFLGFLAGCFIIFLFPSTEIMFSESPADGFFSQLSHIHRHPGPDHLLYPVHLLRYLAVYPAWAANQLDLPAHAWSGLLILYSAPVFLMEMKRAQKVAALGILVVAYFVSFRTCLVVISMTIFYLSIFQDNRSRILITYSALLANLSSGVLLAWIIVAAIYRKRFREQDGFVLGIIAVLCLSLSFSIYDKFSFFISLSNAGEQAFDVEAGASLAKAILSRSTMVAAYMEGQYFRFSVYLFSFLFLTACVVYSLLQKKPQAGFFLVGLTGFLFEGLGPVSFLLCASIFVMGELSGFVAGTGVRPALWRGTRRARG